MAQIQSNRHLLNCKFVRLLCCCGANLLHCRSPLSLVLQSTSITWEPTASRRRPAFSSHLFSPTTLPYHISVSEWTAKKAAILGVIFSGTSIVFLFATAVAM